MNVITCGFNRPEDASHILTDYEIAMVWRVIALAQSDAQFHRIIEGSLSVEAYPNSSDGEIKWRCGEPAIELIWIISGRYDPDARPKRRGMKKPGSLRALLG